MIYLNFLRNFFYLSLLFHIITSSISSKSLHDELKKDTPEWMFNQISQDLSAFSQSGITKEMIAKTLAQDPIALVLIIIKNGNVSVKYNQAMTKQYQIDTTEPLIRALTELNTFVALPNVEFIYSIDDAPFCWQNISRSKPLRSNVYFAPVFTPCKDDQNFSAVLIPDYHTLTSIQNKSSIAIELGNMKYPWSLKKNKAFWRGTTTGGLYRINNYEQFPRIKLAKLSVLFPDLIDAKFNQLWKTDNAVNKKLIELNYIGNTVSIAEHLQYKYQILIDGNASSWYRAYWQFNGNSLVFKQNSNYIVWHNELFKPWIHYIPFDHDCKDLPEKIRWAINNDEMAHNIAQAAQKQAHANLTYTDILLYFYTLITQYAKLQRYKV